MSEFDERAEGFEERPASSSGKWIVIAVVGAVLFAGCLLACAGLAGIGFMLPARQQVRQAERAAADAEQAARQAAEQARALEQKAVEAANPPAKDDSAQPAAGDTPAKDGPQEDREE